MTSTKANSIKSVHSNFLIYNDLNSIPDNLKSELNLGSLIMSENYFKALEASSIPGMSFRYIFLHQDNHLKGFYYFQIINLASKELGKIIHLDPYSKTLNHFTGVINAILFGAKKEKPHYLLIAGNMIMSGEFGILNIEKDKIVFEHLNNAVKDVTLALEKNGKVVSTIIKDFSNETDQVKEPLLTKSYSLLVMDPIMKMELQDDWKIFPDYLEALSAKYRLRYNNARKKIESLTIKDLSFEEILSQQNSIDPLYKAVQHKSPIQLVKFDCNYLLEMSQNLGDNFKFRGYYLDGKMIAFLCGIKTNDQYEAHHIGIDYQYNRSHSLYLNILYEFIGLAIETKSKNISFGRTAMEMKTTVGARPVSYNAYIKLNNYMLNCLVKNFLPSEAMDNWTARNPFKDSK